MVSIWGRDPDRAMAYHMRVPMLHTANVTAKVEFNSAIKTSHHTGPHTRLATTMAGNSGEVGSVPMILVPQPRIIAQVTKTRKMPSKMIEPITVSYTHLTLPTIYSV